MLTTFLLSLSATSAPATLAIEPTREPATRQPVERSLDQGARERAAGNTDGLFSTDRADRLSRPHTGQNGSLHGPGTQNLANTGLGGTPSDSSATIVDAWPHPSQEGMYEFRITDTGTWQERFLVQVPGVPATSDVPMLMAFHSYSISYWDIVLNTTFIDEVLERGWYLVAPIGGTDINFSSPASVNNTELVMELVLQHFNIDKNRLFGVGFSMGGGNVMNYAARHLDPGTGMFAAVVNHTGTLDITDVYASDPAIRWALEILHEGTPDQYPFNYQQASIMTLDPVTREVDMTNDLARNLTHIPMLSFRAENEPIAYLADQTDIFRDHMVARGGMHWLTEVPGNEHSWSTIDEYAICNFFNFHTLEVPMSGDTLVDRGGKYFHFDVNQQEEGQFSSFMWDIDQSDNKITILNTDNVNEIVVDTASAGINPDDLVKVQISTADGIADTIILNGFNEPPMNVTVDGQNDSTWVWDPVKRCVKIIEDDGAFHVWRVTPR